MVTSVYIDSHPRVTDQGTRYWYEVHTCIGADKTIGGSFDYTGIRAWAISMGYCVVDAAREIGWTCGQNPPCPPIITYITAYDSTDGRVFIDFGVSGSGNVTVKIDGVTKWQGALNNTTHLLDFPVSGGTHEVCVTVV